MNTPSQLETAPLFEQSIQHRSNAIWKFLPLALGAVALIVTAAIYLSRHEAVTPPALQGMIRSDDTRFDWYSQYLSLKDPKIQMGLNFAGNRIVMLSGLIENAGERSLDAVEIKVVFYNYEEPIWETVRAPVRPGPYTPAIPPLTERSFSFYIEKIPEKWKSSHAEMSLNGFRFASATAVEQP